MSETQTTPQPPRLRTTWRRIYAAGTILGLVVTLVAPSFWPYLLRIEHSTSDLRTAHLSPRLDGPHPRVAMVTVSEQTFPALKFPRGSPTNRAMMAEILRRLDKVGACAIGIDFLFLSETSNDEALQRQLKAMRTPTIIGVAVPPIPLTPEQRDFQSRFVDAAGLPAAYLNLRKEKEDDTVRMFPSPPPAGNTIEGFAEQLARQVRPDATSPRGRRIAWLRPPLGGDTFVTIPAHTLATDGPDKPPGCTAQSPGLEGKIILLGGDFPNLDRHRTPFAPQLEMLHSGLYVHAQMTADIVDGERRAIRELTVAQSAALQVALAIAGFLLGWRFSASSLAHSLGWTAGTAGLLAIGVLCFLTWNLVLPFAVALLTWALAVTSGRAVRTLRL
jgi:adenylate cyclase